jgi:hypothetical protein
LREQHLEQWSPAWSPSATKVVKNFLKLDTKIFFFENLQEEVSFSKEVVISFRFARNRSCIRAAYVENFQLWLLFCFERTSFITMIASVAAFGGKNIQKFSEKIRIEDIFLKNFEEKVESSKKVAKRFRFAKNCSISDSERKIKIMYGRKKNMIYEKNFKLHPPCF